MTKREICERLMSIHNSAMFASGCSGVIGGSPCYGVGNAIRELILDIVAREEEPVPEPKSKFPIGHPLHMSTEEMKAADTALFTQTGGRMGKDWRNTEEKKEPPVLIYEENGENWSYCKKCGVSFRLKRGEGEKDL